MKDRSAFDAAQKRIGELDEKISSEKNKMADAQARLASYEQERAEMEKWLSVWYDLTGTAKPTAAERMEINPPARTRRPKNPDREIVVDRVLEVIRERGAPQSRKDLFDALKARGMTIQGKDPEMVLSTMLWRSQEKIVRLPGWGYWPTDEIWQDALYYPNLVDIIDVTDRDPEGGEIEEDEDE